MKKETKLKIIEKAYKWGCSSGIYSNKVEDQYNKYAIDKISKDEYYGRSDFMNHKSSRAKWYINDKLEEKKLEGTSR